MWACRPGGKADRLAGGGVHKHNHGINNTADDCGRVGQEVRQTGWQGWREAHKHNNAINNTADDCGRVGQEVRQTGWQAGSSQA